jgi:hypothetical protein
METATDKTQSKVEVIEDEAPEEPFLARVLNLVLELQKTDGYENHKGIKNFAFVVEATMKEPEEGDKLGLERQVARESSITEAFENFYLFGRESLLKGNLAFLTKKDYSIKIGKKGTTFLPISEIYQYLEKEEAASTVTIDATVFFIAQHVCPEEDFDEIHLTCKEFRPAERPGINFFDMVGGIINKVTDKVEKSNVTMQNEDGSLNPIAIGETVQDLFSGGDLADSVQDMIQAATGEEFDINAAAGKLFNNVKK